MLIINKSPTKKMYGKYYKTFVAIYKQYCIINNLYSIPTFYYYYYY